MKIDRDLFRAYDIRAVAMGDDPDLTPEIMELVGKAAGTYFVRKGRKQMVCGRDGRITSPEFQDSFIKGVLSTGLNVTNIGLATSPMLYFASCLERFDCGANVTASHNQKQDNGVKFVDTMAHSVFADELQKFPDLIEADDFEEGEGNYNEESVFDEYFREIWSKVRIERPLKVVMDTGNGVAGAWARKMFESQFIDLEVMYEEVDGNFPHHEANPQKEKNMEDLKARVLEVGADIGIGFDGDGDRIGVVDEKGRFHVADKVLALFAEDVLERNPGREVVFSVNCSKVAENHIKECGGVPIRFKVGHSYIEEKVDPDKAILGGEVSGHFYFAEDYYGYDDAFLAALKLIEIVSEMEGTLADWFDSLPEMISSEELRLSCPDKMKFKFVEEVVNSFKERGMKVNEIDGAFVELDENTWGLFRASNTSPNITLRFESDSQDKMNELVDTFYEVAKGRDYFDAEPILGVKK